MRKKKGFLSLLITMLTVFVLSLSTGIIFSLSSVMANAAGTNDGGAGKAISQKSAVAYEYEEYVVAQNDDFGGAATLSWGSGNATSGLTLNNDLPTASFVYKFSYTPNGGGQTALALRSSYYGDYHFVFQGKKLQYNLKAGYVAVGEVFTDGPQLVEVGAIEIKDSDLTWFFLKVNGEVKMSATAANVPNVKGISAWGDQTAKIAQYSYDVSFTGVETREVLAGQAIGNLPTAPKKVGYDFVKWTCGGEEVTAETVVSADMTVVAEYAERGYYIDEELEEYVVAQNDDFGGAAILSWPNGVTSGLTLKNDLPTASFVYKFNFTPNAGGDTALAVRSSSWGAYYFAFNGKTLRYHLNADDVTVGEVFTDGAQLVEVGAIEIKNSDLTWFFLKVDGEIKMSATAANVPETKAISAWGVQTAVLAQYSYDVSFTGVETREVLVGEQIGSLPTAPKQAGKRFVGWMDQNGNTVTSETKPTSNLTVTGKYETYYEDSELEDYVVAQNDDFGGAPTLSLPNEGATNGLRLNNDTATASFVYKFNFTPNAGGDTALAVRSSSWGAYYFAFKGKTLRYHLNANDVMVGEVFTDGAQLVEVGVIDIKDSNLTWFFLKVNGEIKMSATASDVPDVKGISVWGDQTAKLEQVSFYEESELEDYVVVQNDDFGAATTLSCPNEGATNGLVLNNDLPTASFVYKFNFTPNSGGQTALALRSSYYGDYHCLFQGKTLKYNLNGGYVTVGEVFTDGAQLVEVGVIDIKDSNLTWFYLKIDGQWIVSETASDVPDVKGISVWGESAIFEQYSYSVTFKGIETREVLVGETIGDLPDIGVSAIWKDTNGNIITADTVPTLDLYLTTDAKLQFTIKDTEGNDIVIDYTVGEEIEYDAYGELTKDSTTFIGYLVGETLYKDLSDAIIEQEKTGEEIIAKTITVGIIDGASIRLSATNASIRFTSAISIADSEKVLDFGILLTTEDVRQTLSEFTIAGLHGVDSSLYYNYNKNSGNLRYVENKDYANQYVYSLVLEKVSKANYGVKYAARAYVLVEYADGTQAYVYGEFDEENHVRSMYDVASAAIVDNAAGYTDTQKTIIQKYIDGVIDLNGYLELQGRERNYTVSVSDIDANGDYTVTVTPKNGFDITGIGAIYVEGVKVAVKGANANTGTFKISESDMYANVLAAFEQSMTERNDITALQIAAYSGPSLGVKQISADEMVAGGYVATYDDLKTYMEAGFDAWYVDASCLVSVTGYTAKGATYNGDTPTYDVYRALDLAAEYANETGKPCPVYINIPHLTGMVMSEAYAGTTWIKLIYSIFTNYNDGVTTAANSPVNGINQLGGFMLHDEPTLANYDAFAAVFNEIAYNCGAIAAGYDFTCALLPTYAGSDNIGSSYAEYVNKYATLMQDTRISFDNYPFYYVSTNNSSQNLMASSWYSDMQAVRTNANGKGTCIQSFTAGAKESNSTTKYRYIDKEAEISMQVYTALAYGFTNLDYFVYWDKMTRAMMEANGATGEVFQKTPIMWNDPNDWSKGHYQSEYYGWIKNTNAEAKSLFEILSKFTSTGVQLIDGSTSGSNDFGSATTTNTTNAITVSATYDMVVGGFTADGYNGYLAVNADFPDDNGTRTNTATFTVGTAYTKAIVYVDGVATVVRVAKDGTLNLNIGCGEGVFIIPVESHKKHEILKKQYIAATCTEDGNIEYYFCTICQKNFLDKNGKEEISLNDTILHKGHIANEIQAQPASCLGDGNLAYWECTRCGNLYFDEECTERCQLEDIRLAQLSHEMEFFNEQPATTQENGWVEHYVCIQCGKFFSDPQGENELAEEDVLLYALNSLVDFVVELETDEAPVVLQLTDTQIIDAAQARTSERLNDTLDDFWATSNINDRCYDYLTEVINTVKPDLIILTGDIVYGEFDDAGTAWLSFIEFMEGFKIPWAPIFGNHDNESAKGVDWQCEQLENAEYCLFKQRELTGNGNYSVGIVQNDELKRVFYMLDSNGCTGASSQSLSNGHTQTSVGFGEDQIQWYTTEINRLKGSSPNTKISFAFHIQQFIFAEAFAKYGYDHAEKYQDIYIDFLKNKDDGDFGYIGRQIKNPWDENNTVWDGMKQLGVDSVFVGHEHCNSASVIYDGIRLQYGQKSSEYDRFNCLNSDGTITGNYTKTGTSLIGGTVIPLSVEDSAISDPYIYFCENAGGAVDWDKWNEDYNSEPVFVNGLQYGSDTSAAMYSDTSLTVKEAEFDNTTAYCITATGQGKLFINLDLLKGKNTFTFTVFLTEESTARLAGLGEFAIRIKPNDLEPSLDGSINGYIKYDSQSSAEQLKIIHGTWQTFTVDISNLDGCTEFAFVIPATNVMYIKDVVID